MGFMDTLARIPKMLEANLNALLDKAEDPEKMIDQMLIDYKRNLADVKRDTAEVMANLEIAESELNEAKQKVEKYGAAAQAAVNAGNLEDARTLITSKQAAEVTVGTLQKNYDLCLQNSNMMKAGYNKLVQDIEVLEQRKDAAKAKISLARAQEQINKTQSKIAVNNISDSFAKYEAKADKMLAVANASAKLDHEVETADDILAKYNGAGASTSVEAELQALLANKPN